jgi:hypothetical protein
VGSRQAGENDDGIACVLGGGSGGKGRGGPTARDGGQGAQTTPQHHLYTTQPSPRASYAEVARTPLASQPSGLRTISLSSTTSTTFTNTLFYIVDISRVEESEKGKVQVADIRKAIEVEI